MSMRLLKNTDSSASDTMEKKANTVYHQLNIDLIVKQTVQKKTCFFFFFSLEVGVQLALQARNKHSSKFNSETKTAVQVVTAMLVLASTVVSSHNMSQHLFSGSFSCQSVSFFISLETSMTRNMHPLNFYAF